MLRAASLLARSNHTAGFTAVRTFSATAALQMKVLCCLYEAGLLGCKENALGLRPWLESQGHKFVVTADKEGPNSEFERELVDADIVITTPFHPGYITKERLAKAKNLKVSITAGVGSDHVDIPAACEKKLAVYEVTGSNVTSVAEHVVMQILALVRNFVPAHEQIKAGDWRVADVAREAYDIEGKVIGTLGAGRIGYRVLQRLVPFEPKELLYADYQPLTPDLEKAVGARRVSVEELFKQCDIITINTPLTAETRGMVNKKLLGLTKKGVYIVNTARGAIVERDDLVEFVNSGHVQGYAGDVWFPQPAPKDHPWRYMPRNAMTPHYSGTTLDAQARYANGVKLILERYFAGKPQDAKDIIAENGTIVSKAYDKAGSVATTSHVKKEAY